MAGCETVSTSSLSMLKPEHADVISRVDLFVDSRNCAAAPRRHLEEGHSEAASRPAGTEEVAVGSFVLDLPDPWFLDCRCEETDYARGRQVG